MKARHAGRVTATAAVLLFTLAVNSGPVHACACCSNEGQRTVETEKIDAYSAGVLAEIRFADAAHIYTGEADLESIGGVTAKSTDFHLAVTQTEASWEFAFGNGGDGGNLTFKLPKGISKFEVDPREADPDSSRQGPLLYKEWRLTTKAVGTGMFKGATGGDQQATLILHGRGKNCTDASQFTAWTLVLHGSKATNTLFGTLSAQ